MPRPWETPPLQSLSLTWKLTLAFVLVGMLGVLLFLLLLGQRTRTEFNQFLSTRDASVLIDALEDYYRLNRSWDGIMHQREGNRPLDLLMRGSILLDAQGQVLLPHPPHMMGQQLSPAQLADTLPIQVDGETVGYLLLTGSPMAWNMHGAPATLEDTFLRRVLNAALTSAGITILVALILGFVLARTLTRPLRELTAATQVMATGAIPQQVMVRTQDEIGQLAHSFNQMSIDLARSSQARKQMTADLAHDLRTPLSILRGYIEGLKEGRMAATPELYDLLFEEIIHLQRLIDDLRVLSLADAGELSLNRRLVDPAALLERAGLAHMSAAESRGIDLRVETAPALPSIAVDTDRMAQVFNNLVANALRHTQQGEVVLSGNVHAGAVELSVRDSGQGIAATDLPYIFDRFYRGDKSRHRNAAGSEADSLSSSPASSGLGLAIAKALVEAHGGTLTAQSTLGAGSTFTVRISPASPTTVG